MRRTLKFIRKIFPVRSCNLAIPSSRKYRVCLDYHIDRCPGCCEPGKTTPEEYAKIIKGVILMLSGRSDEVVDLGIDDVDDVLLYTPHVLLGFITQVFLRETLEPFLQLLGSGQILGQQGVIFHIDLPSALIRGLPPSGSGSRLLR